MTVNDAARRPDLQPRRSALRRAIATLTIALLAVSGLWGLSLAQQATPSHATTWDKGFRAYGTLFMFVKAGECVYVEGGSYTKNMIRGDTGQAVGTVAKNNCTSYVASQDGIWQIEVNGTEWAVQVRESDGVTEIPGRVWSEGLSFNQTGNVKDAMDIDWYVVNDTGYQYKLDMPNYMGIDSKIQATANGMPKSVVTTGPRMDCRPSYANYKARSGKLPDCGGLFRMFFQKPADDLPAIGIKREGGAELSRYVAPAPLTEQELKDSLKITYTPATAESLKMPGTFTMKMDPRFMGGALLNIDVDGDGNYDGPRDLEIEQYSGGGGEMTYAWDGKDANGDPVVFDGSKLNAQLSFDRLGEVHLAIFDVEGRDGISLIRQNGEGAPDSTIYYNDAPTDGATFPESGPLDPVNSSGTTHGWPYLNSARDGHGDSTFVDDWTYLSIETANATTAFGGYHKLHLTASANKTKYSPGDEVKITYNITNSGTWPMSGVDIVSEDWTGTGERPQVACTPAEPTPIPAGGTATCVLTYVATGDDETIAELVDTVHATGTPEDGADPVDSKSVTTKLTPAPRSSLAITSVVADKESFVAGEQVNYTYTVKNDGNQPIIAVSMKTDQFTGDRSKSGITCTPTNLQPGQEASCTARYTPNMNDVGNAVISDTVHARGYSQSARVWLDTSTGTVEVPAATPSMNLTLTSEPENGSSFAEGDNVTYTFEVENTGDVDLGNIDIPQGAFTGTNKGTGAGQYPPVVTCAPDKLPAGSTDKAICTIEYTATAADVTRGSISVTTNAVADVVEDATLESPVVRGTPDQVTSNVVTDTVHKAEPALEISGATLTDASGNEETFFEEGQQLKYVYEVTNTGNVALTDVGIDQQSFNGAGDRSGFPHNVTCAPSTLAPGEKASCEGTYEPTAADVTRGSISAVVNAIGTPATGDPIESATNTTSIQPSEPELTLEMTADTEMFVPGEPVTYTYQVQNSGNEQVDGVSIAEDTFTGEGGSNWGALSCSPDPTDLAPGAAATCTRVYTPTVADKGKKSLANAVHAAGTLGSGTEVTSKPQSIAIPAEQPKLDIITSTVENQTEPGKGEDFTGTPGNVLDYTFTVKNNGNVPLDDVTVSMSGFTGAGTPPVVTCTPEALSVGEEATCTASYTTVQGDIDASEIRVPAQGTAEVEGKETPVFSAPTALESHLNEPSIAISKVVAPENFRAGEEIEIVYTIENTGTGDLEKPRIVTDSTTATGTKPAPVTCTPDPVTSGSTATCRVKYTPTDEDVDNGSISNVAHATGETGNPAVTVSSKPKTTEVESLEAALKVEASIVNPDYRVGDTITMPIKVTNTGNVPMTKIEPVLTTFSGANPTKPEINCPTTPDPLPVGETLECTATYTAVQADVDAGKITAVVQASGETTDGTPVQSKADPAVVGVDGNKPELDIDVTTDKSGFVEGETVTYSYTVKNTGTTPVDNIGVDSDSFTGAGTPGEITCAPTALGGTLPIGEETVCTQEYVPTAADTGKETIGNTLHATGEYTYPDAGSVGVVSVPDTSNLPKAKPGLTLKTTSVPEDGFIAGEKISYTYEIANSGDVPLDGITLTTDAFSGSATPGALVCWVTDPGTPVSLATVTLAPGESVNCRETYTATPQDQQAATLNNVKTATATVAGSSEEIATDPVAKKIDAANPELTIEKVETDRQNFVQGEPVTYTYTVKNTGDLELTDVTIAPDTFGGSGGFPDPADIVCAPRDLAVDESATCTLTYTPTSEDGAKSALNSRVHASANANPKGGGDPQEISSTSAEKNLPAATPKLAVDATADKQRFVAGTPITYTVKVTNPGNRGIDEVALELPTGLDGTFGEVVCDPTSLDPGDDAATCKVTYTAAEPDEQRGSIEMPFVAKGEVQGTDVPVTSESDSVTTPAAKPALTMVGNADKASYVAGETVNYTYTVTNTGDIVVEGVTVEPETDQSFTGADGFPATVSCTPKDLKPREQASCVVSYTATAADESGASIASTVVAKGNAPGSSTTTKSAPVEIDLPAAEPQLEITGGPDRERYVAGDRITYTYEVRNTGDRDIANVAIDPVTFPDSSEISCTPTSLPAGADAVAVCAATHVATEAEVEAGAIASEVKATGNVAGTDRAVETAQLADTVTAFVPSLQMELTADTDTVQQGEEIVYTYTVKNTGTDPIENLVVDEGTFSGSGAFPAVTCVPAALAVGETAICTSAPYTVTAADAMRGSLTNSARASGNVAGTTAPASSNSDYHAADVLKPGLKIEAPDDIGPFTEGTPIEFPIDVTNTGEIDLSNVTVALDKWTGNGTPSIECPPTNSSSVAALPVGQTVQCTVVYTPDATDADRGTIVAIASASGATSTTPPVTAKSEPVTTASVNLAPALKVEASVDKGIYGPGEELTYTFVVTNDGNVAINGTHIDPDEFIFDGNGEWGTLECDPSSPADLDAYAEMVCTMTYTTTTEDAARQSLPLSVVAAGTVDGIGTPIESLPDSVTGAPEQPELSVMSQVDRREYRPGQPLTYSFAVENTGNVRLDNVSIDTLSFNGHNIPANAVCEPTVLEVDETARCTVEYLPVEGDSLMQGDLDLVAAATGVSPANTQATSNATEQSTPVAPPALSLDLKGPKQYEAGKEMTYTFAVQNPGGVPLDKVSVKIDGFSGTEPLGDLTCLPDPASTRLSPSIVSTADAVTEIICTATYTPSIADVQAGKLDLSAFATGIDPRDGSVIVASPTQELEMLVNDDPTNPDGKPKTNTDSRVANTGAPHGPWVPLGAAFLLLGLGSAIAMSRAKSANE